MCFPFEKPHTRPCPLRRFFVLDGLDYEYRCMVVVGELPSLEKADLSREFVKDSKTSHRASSLMSRLRPEQT